MKTLWIDCVGKLPQILIVTWKANQVSLKQEKLIWISFVWKE